ncbi:hypothetical protein [Burkholderia diffusa]|uniref:hypothetical protein n=1 Tax=Burkholderia diffusa TaxID=488732 RepID=UPI0018C6D657|nr:hypothetical protein [Burkholderia diffusa]
MIAGSRDAARFARRFCRRGDTKARPRATGFTWLLVVRQNGRQRVNPARFSAGRFFHYSADAIHTIKPSIFDMGARTILEGYKTGKPHSSGSFPMIDTLFHADMAYRTSKERNRTQRSCCEFAFRITSYHPENKIME